MGLAKSISFCSVLHLLPHVTQLPRTLGETAGWDNEQHGILARVCPFHAAPPFPHHHQRWLE